MAPDDASHRDEPASLDRLRELVAAAEAGEPGGVQSLREELARLPASSELLRSMVPAAVDAWVAARASGSRVRREVTEREIRRLAWSLEQGDNPLERLLIERICVCWLALDVAECSYVERTGKPHRRGDEEYWSRRVDGAQRRFLAACRTLAQVRRLGLSPVVEVRP